jgi:transposase
MGEYLTYPLEITMPQALLQEMLVSIDIGCYGHHVAIGLSDGELLEEFEMEHTRDGFKQFFARVESHRQSHQVPVSIAMEGYNGHARPLDRMIRARNYRLFNINNLKLARFKEVFPGAAKTDSIDARKGLELFQLRRHLPKAKDPLQEIYPTPVENEQLKRLSRRRRRMVDERVSVMNSLQSDLQAVCPGLLKMTKDVSQKWFLNFLISTRSNLTELARKKKATLLKIKGVGKILVERIIAWQETAVYSDEVELVTPLILEDVQRIIDLNQIIQKLDDQLEAIAASSEEAIIIKSIPGFGKTCTAEIAGEMGTVDRFAKESSLALYFGMAALDNSSGKYQGSKAPKQVNARIKSAMMTAVDRHRKQVASSQAYYEKKRAEGKTHNQAIRALGRHLCRVIFKMLKEKREYKII